MIANPSALGNQLEALETKNSTFSKIGLETLRLKVEGLEEKTSCVLTVVNNVSTLLSTLIEIEMKRINPNSNQELQAENEQLRQKNSSLEQEVNELKQFLQTLKEIVR